MGKRQRNGKHMEYNKRRIKVSITKEGKISVMLTKK